MGRVAVALGAGGARGYAHVGVLEVLAERGHEVVAVAGTSMGALVGGVVAAGRLAAYTEWARSLTQREVLRLLDPALTGPAGLRAERVIAKIDEIVEGALIEDLPIPFTAVATDLNARREVWFQRGRLDTAIRASIAIPSIITPVVVDGRLLVDGGLINPVPIEPTSAVPSDFTVAVSLFGPRLAGPIETSAPASPARPFHTSVLALSARLPRGLGRAARSGSHPGAETGPGGDTEGRSAEDVALGWSHPPKDLSSVELLARSFDTMASLISRYRMAGNPPDVLIRVPSDACRTLDFHRAAEVIALGRSLAVEALDAAHR